MWAGHVNSSFRWIFFWLLSIQSPYASLLCALSVRFWRIFNASTVAFIEIWGNCPCLLTRPGFGMITVEQLHFDCICWLVPVATDSSVFIRSKFYCLESVEKYSEGNITVAHICKHDKQFLKRNTIFLKHKSISVKHNTKLSKHNTKLSKHNKKLLTHNTKLSKHNKT